MGKLGSSSPDHGTEKSTTLPQVLAAVPALPPRWQLWADSAVSEDHCPGSPIKDTSEQGYHNHLTRGKQSQGVSH